MNLHHFQAFLWLRWRLRINQWKRAGTANAVLLAILSVAAVVAAVVLFILFFLGGLFLGAKVPPIMLMYIWDGLVGAFLFYWFIGLLIELQKSEAFSLTKFLHLPVSLAGAFLINYFSSLLSFSLLLFVPVMVGLAAGLVFARGPAMLLLFPLLFALLLLITALTYQFQSWLATLMANPRRRRTVIVVATMIFILVAQVPNLVNILHPWGKPGSDETALMQAQNTEKAELLRSLAAGQITQADFQQRQAQIEQKFLTQIDFLHQEKEAQFHRTGELINLILPPGWLPLGARELADGNVVPALLGTLGLTLLGTASLWRAYRTNLSLYTGQYTKGKRRPTMVSAPVSSRPSSPLWLEKKVPGLSEHVSAIALTTFFSILRAPEVKLLFLAPILMMVIFGGLFFTHPPQLPQNINIAPFLSLGAMSMILFTMIGLLGNQFGLDRNGYRVLVLCPASRRDILLGKNLALAPLVLGFGLVFAGVLQAIFRTRFDLFLAVLPLLVSLFLLFCLWANCLSILGPMRIGVGSLKPANPKILPILLQICSMFLLPVILVPIVVPLLIQVGWDELGWVRGVPIGLVLSLAEFVGVVFLYRLVLAWQGRWLQRREQTILDIVTTQ